MEHAGKCFQAQLILGLIRAFPMSFGEFGGKLIHIDADKIMYDLNLKPFFLFPVRNTFLENEDFEVLSVRELIDPSLQNWVHHVQHILPQVTSFALNL